MKIVPPHSIPVRVSYEEMNENEIEKYTEETGLLDTKCGRTICLTTDENKWSESDTTMAYAVATSYSIRNTDSELRDNCVFTSTSQYVGIFIVPTRKTKGGVIVRTAAGGMLLIIDSE